MRIGCIQLDIKKGEIDKNYAEVEKKLFEVCKRGVDVVVLPEMWNTGYNLEHIKNIADRNGDRTKKFLMKKAKEYGINIVGGSIAELIGEKVYNTMYTVNRNGEVVGTYSKVHLFQLMNEHQYLDSGSQLGLFELDGITCGGNICYDLRFPEWFRVHGYNGAKVMFVVAQWPSQRSAHWETLLKARAIENQCFVVGCNRIGIENNHHFQGNSLIIDPWGEIINCLGEKAYEVTTIDLHVVENIRERIPVYTDCKKQLYAEYLLLEKQKK